MMSRREIRFWFWLTNLFPDKLLYFCIMIVWARATTRLYKDKSPDEVTWSMALKTLRVKGG